MCVGLQYGLCQYCLKDSWMSECKVMQPLSPHLSYLPLDRYVNVAPSISHTYTHTHTHTHIHTHSHVCTSYVCGHSLPIQQWRSHSVRTNWKLESSFNQDSMHRSSYIKKYANWNEDTSSNQATARVSTIEQLAECPYRGVPLYTLCMWCTCIDTGRPTLSFGIATDGDSRWGEFSCHSIGHWLHPKSGGRKWAWSPYSGGQAPPS